MASSRHPPSYKEKNVLGLKYIAFRVSGFNDPHTIIHLP